MRPAEYSNEEIIQAGKDLQAAGRRVTGFALRKQVGGGNVARLRQIWGEYAAQQNTKQDEVIPELPIEVAEELTAFGSEIMDRMTSVIRISYDKLIKAAERRVTEVIRAAGEQRTLAESELADAAQTVDDLEASLEQMTAELEAAREKLGAVQATNKDQAVELAALRERLSAADQKARTAEDTLSSERKRHQQQSEALRTEIENQRSELATMKGRAEAAAEERTRMTERLAVLEGERDTARQDAAAARQDAAGLSAQILSLNTQVATLEGERNTARQEATEAREEAGKLSAQASGLQTQLADEKQRGTEVVAQMEKRIKGLETEVRDAQAKALGEATRAGQLEGQVATLREQILAQTETIARLTPKPRTAGKSAENKGSQ